MKPYWIVENFTKESSYVELVKEIQKQNLNLIELNNGYQKSDLKSIPNKSCVIFQGSIEMSKIIYDELTGRLCAPICHSSFDNYRCSCYYSYYGRSLFNDKYALITLKELARQRYLYYGIFGKDALIFIRPDDGDKPFQAQLLDLLDLDRFVEQNQKIEHKLVLVSTPKNIRGEWRFIVTKHQEILGYSLYQYQGQITKIPSAPEKAIAFVKDLLNINYCPDSVFCMDICEDLEGNFYLMELTSFSSAGLYASKKDLIVKRVSEIALDDFNNHCLLNQQHD